MNKSFLILMVALLFQSCATQTPKTDKLVKDHSNLPQAVKISPVPFVKQADYHCGPATLAMVMQFHQWPVDLNELTSQMYTPGSKGTFNSDLVSTIRRQGLLAIPINDLENLLLEISAQHPVIVFQNIGFSFKPTWHYALALGYNLKGPDIMLHSGEEEFKKMDMRLFERSWILAKKQAWVVLPPGKISASADDLTHVSVISELERMGKLIEAKTSYEAVISKWPQSLPALIGLGNVYYTQNNFLQSIRVLKQASLHHPGSAIAWHNLATAQGAAGELKQAKSSALKALEFVESSQQEMYQGSLKEWMK